MKLATTMRQCRKNVDFFSLKWTKMTMEAKETTQRNRLLVKRAERRQCRASLRFSLRRKWMKLAMKGDGPTQRHRLLAKSA